MAQALPPEEALELALELVGRPAVHLPGPRGSRHAVLVAHAGPYAPRKARDLAARACHDWSLAAHADLAALVADELVTNAVKHTGTRIELHLRHLGDLLHVAVHDQGGSFDPTWWDRAVVDPSTDADAPAGG